MVEKARLLTVEARLAAFRATTRYLAILSSASTRNASCPTKAFFRTDPLFCFCRSEHPVGVGKCDQQGNLERLPIPLHRKAL
jgi:hypothetical protein